MYFQQLTEQSCSGSDSWQKFQCTAAKIIVKTFSQVSKVSPSKHNSYCCTEPTGKAYSEYKMSSVQYTSRTFYSYQTAAFLTQTVSLKHIQNLATLVLDKYKRGTFTSGTKYSVIMCQPRFDKSNWTKHTHIYSANISLLLRNLQPPHILMVQLYIVI